MFLKVIIQAENSGALDNPSKKLNITSRHSRAADSLRATIKSELENNDDHSEDITSGHINLESENINGTVEPDQPIKPKGLDIKVDELNKKKK